MIIAPKPSAGQAAVTILISLNDLEALAIRALAEGLAGIELRDLGLRWGEDAAATLASRHPVASLAATVIMVECPAQPYEDAVRASGRVLHVVDHHLLFAGNGERMDRRSKKSSLEQVARLLGVMPDADQRLIAANDSDYWPGLWQAARAYPDLLQTFESRLAWCRDVRRLDLAMIAGQDRSDEKDRSAGAADLLAFAEQALANLKAAGRVCNITPHNRTGAGLTNNFWLIQTDDDVRGLCDAVYLDVLCRCQSDAIRSDDIAQTIAIVATPGGGPARKLFLSGGAQLAAVIDELTAMVQADPLGARARIHAGAGPVSAFMEISADFDISPLVDQCLAELIIDSRPVLNWSSQFFQFLHAPELVIDESKSAPIKLSEEAKAYFTPAVADCFTASKGSSQHLSGWRSRAQPVAFCLESAKAKLHADFAHVAVHRGPEDVAVIEWAMHDMRDGPADIVPWWSWLLLCFASRHAKEGTRALTLADVLELNAYARFVCPAFKNGDWLADIVVDWPDGFCAPMRFGAAVCPDQQEPQFWFAELVKRMIGDEAAKTARIMIDARARSVNGVALSGPSPRTPGGIARHDMVLARLMAVDRPDAGWAYDPAFARAELERGRYRRFASYGTHYAASGYSFAGLGYGTFFGDFVIGTDWSEASRQLIKKPGQDTEPYEGHLRAVYARMFLLPQLASVVFDRLESRQAKALAGREESPSDHALERARANTAYNSEINDLRRRMTDFVSGLWFEEASLQLQGQELYRLMLDQSNARARHRQLRDAIADADQVDADQQRRDDERHRDNIAVLATGFATALGIFSIIAASTAAKWTYQYWPVWVGGTLIIGLLVSALAIRQAEARRGRGLGYRGAVWKVIRRICDLLKGQSDPHA